MSYTEVNRILTETADAHLTEQRDNLRQIYADVVPMLEDMADLAAILQEKRRKRGSIDFDFPESKIQLDEAGNPIAIKPYERNVATRLIEDFMLLANETVAGHFFWQEIPFVYRTHGTPDPDKMRELAAFISNFGYCLKSSMEEIHPKELQKLLASIAGSDEEALISRLTLRSMRKAQYSVENVGHFGLACGCYSHFTSPIRRYPDLQIHRIIREQLSGQLSPSRMDHYRAILPSVCQTCSQTERRSDEAERETVKCKKAQYMEKHLGEIFDGVISGITQWGIYVELPNTIEGMIRVADLPGDYYVYNEKTHEMVGEHSGRTYRLGQRLRILVQAADRQLRTVDFAAIDETEGEDGFRMEEDR